MRGHRCYGRGLLREGFDGVENAIDLGGGVEDVAAEAHGRRAVDGARGDAPALPEGLYYLGRVPVLDGDGDEGRGGAALEGAGGRTAGDGGDPGAEVAGELEAVLFDFVEAD